MGTGLGAFRTYSPAGVAENHRQTSMWLQGPCEATKDSDTMWHFPWGAAEPELEPEHWTRSPQGGWIQLGLVWRRTQHRLRQGRQEQRIPFSLSPATQCSHTHTHTDILTHSYRHTCTCTHVYTHVQPCTHIVVYSNTCYSSRHSYIHTHSYTLYTRIVLFSHSF